MADVKFGIGQAYDTNIITMDFPALKEWDITAHQTVNTWIMPSDSSVTIHIEDFDIDFKTGLRLDEHGYIDPDVFFVDIKFGNTMITSGNWFLELMMH